MNNDLMRIATRAGANRVSGSSDIVLAVAQDVVDVCCRSRKVLGSGDFKQFAVLLARAQPNMASVWNLANAILQTDLTVNSVAEECRSASAHHRSAPVSVGKRASGFLRSKTVVTNSSSRAVFEALKAASTRSLVRVYVTESRPRREGILLAKNLARCGLEVVVVSDASLSRAVAKSDVALVGADALNLSSVIGKVGLMSLALTAEEFGVEALVCADTSKFGPIKFVAENQPSREILRRPEKGIEVENVYFEEVPHRLFDRVVTESGHLRPRQIPGVVSRIEVSHELAGLTSVS